MDEGTALVDEVTAIRTEVAELRDEVRRLLADRDQLATALVGIKAAAAGALADTGSRGATEVDERVAHNTTCR